MNKVRHETVQLAVPTGRSLGLGFSPLIQNFAKKLVRLGGCKFRINSNICDRVKVARSMNACTHREIAARSDWLYDSISSQQK
jgi:hypothetical protein